MKRRTLLQATGAVLLPSGALMAQDKYPNKPITWICPYAAGGNADLRSRQMARAMGALLGQPMIVDNKPGAGGNIGTEFIARAKPDGYTLGMGNFAPLAVNQTLFKKINFDPQTDLVPIMLIETGPLVLMVRKDSPLTSMKDLVALAKAKPGELSYGSGGIGGSHHLSAALLEHSAGIDMIHAPFKSGSASTNALMAGQVDMMFEQMYAAMPSIQAGTLRALAITSKNRSPLIPNIPTMGEQGFPAVEVLNWQGLVAPKGLPKELIQLLNSVAKKALAESDMRQKIMSQGNEVGGGSPEAFAALIKSEAVRWGNLVKIAKIEVD